MARTPTIIVENGLSAGLTLELAPESVTLVGRAPDAALCIHADEVSVSRRHCMLDVAAGEVSVKNLQDPDRTRINGEPVNGVTRLHPGDRLTVGKVVMKLLAPPSMVVEDGVDALSLSLADLEDVSDSAAHVDVAEDVSSSVPFMASPAYDQPVAPVPRIMGCDLCGAVDSALVDPDHANSPWLCRACADGRRQHLGARKIQIGPYEIFGKLGEGGMGVVYEGVDPKSGVRVAVKVLRPDRQPTQKEIQRFVREQGIALTLRHPNIVRCFQVGAQSRLFFIASEFVPGGDATGLIGKASAVEILHVGADLFHALGYAHEQSVVHRDVKPANLLVTSAAHTGARRGRLMDFGLAKNVKDLSNRVLTARGEAGGTLTMISPEQLLNFAGSGWSVDIYSGAATIYRLLTGADALVLPAGVAEPNFATIAGAVMSKTRRPLASLRPDLPAPLCAYLDAILAHDAAFRTSLQAKQVADTLSDWAGRLGG